MSLTNPRNGGLIIGLGGFFGGALVHSLLPTPWDIWLRAYITGLTCLVISGILAFTFTRPTKP